MVIAAPVSCESGARPALVRLTPIWLTTTGSRPTAARSRRAVYWVRRTLAVAVVVVAALGLAVAFRIMWIGLASRPLTTTDSGGGARPVVARTNVRVVEPGDSLWSIVRASGVTGDPRPVVDRLEHQLGGRPLQIGQRVVVP